MRDDIASLNAAAQTYLEALHEGDGARLRQIFLPEAHLYTSSDDELKILPVAEYIELVEGRPSPSSQGHTMSGGLVSVDFSGPCTAVVKATTAVPPTRFVDLLNFLKVGDQWRIISKVYHVES